MSYHLRKTEREIKDYSKIESIIKENKYATLGLCKDNEPYVVTLSYGFDEENKYLYFHGSNEGQKIEFLKSNPVVCLTIIDDKGFVENECGHSYRSVIIKGTIEFINQEEERVDAIKIILKHFEHDMERMMKKVNQRTDTWLKTTIFKIKISDLTAKEREVMPHN